MRGMLADVFDDCPAVLLMAGLHVISLSGLTSFSGLAYKTSDLVLHGKPVQVRRGPATVSVEERSENATGVAIRWEGSFDPMKREPGDRPSSHRFESTSKGVSMTILTSYPN